MTGLNRQDQVVLLKKRHGGVKRPPREVIGLWGIHKLNQLRHAPGLLERRKMTEKKNKKTGATTP